MLTERIEGKWIDCFARTFELCRIAPNDVVAILSETLSRQINVHLAELALLRLKTKPFHLVLPSPSQPVYVPIRSTGCSTVVQQIQPVMDALASATMVVDLTVEGMMHAKETPYLLKKKKTRILHVSNEHPEILERLMPDPSLKPKIRHGIEMLRGAKEMHVTSAAGTDLHIKVEGAPSGGGWGAVEQPGTLDHWPGGLVVCFPRAGSINGVLVMDTADMNLTFKRHVERPIRITVKNDFAVDLAGEGLDAELMRSYFRAWGDVNAYAAAHVGWGMNPKGRWDSLVMYDRGDTNGVEQRVFAGNFLYSTGANEFANRFTLGHFDLPFRNCTIALDGKVIIERGQLQGELA